MAANSHGGLEAQWWLNGAWLGARPLPSVARKAAKGSGGTRKEGESTRKVSRSTAKSHVQPKGVCGKGERKLTKGVGKGTPKQNPVNHTGKSGGKVSQGKKGGRLTKKSPDRRGKHGEIRKSGFPEKITNQKP